jgi:hypothetical protein
MDNQRANKRHTVVQELTLQNENPIAVTRVKSVYNSNVIVTVCSIYRLVAIIKKSID